MEIKKILSEWGINAIALVAGTIGGFIILTLNDKEMSFRNASCQLVSSMAFASYGTEMLVNWLQLKAYPSINGLIGLCLGICGLFVAKGIIKLGKRFETNPESFIQKKGGINNDTSN